MSTLHAQPPYRPPFRSAYVPERLPCPRQVDAEELPSLGWLRIVEQGEENTYMETEEGAIVYVKI